MSSAVLVCLSVAAITVGGCGSDNSDSAASSDGGNYGYGKDVPAENADGQLIQPPVQIFAGTDAKRTVSADTVEIITSQGQFEEMQKQLFGKKNAQPLPSTDFATRQMILVLLKPANNGAQTQVSDVRVRDDGFTVTAVRLLPGKGCKGETDKTKPFNIAETNKLKGSPTLKVKTQRGQAC